MERQEYREMEKYYDTIWNRYRGLTLEELTGRYFFTSEVAKIKNQTQKRLSILDLGCGRGWLTDALSEYGDVLGVDLSIKIAQKLYPRSKFLKANIITANIGGTYDIIISAAVIEHVLPEHREIFMKKCYDLLNEADELQPQENWMSKEQVLDLMRPYFVIEFVGSFHFYPRLIRKRRILTKLYCQFMKLSYKPIQKMLKSTFHGLLLAIVGRKRYATDRR